MVRLGDWLLMDGSEEKDDRANNEQRTLKEGETERESERKR